MPEKSVISAKTIDQIKMEFKQYHYERFSQDLRNWFKIELGFGGKPVNFVLQAGGDYIFKRPAKCSDSLFHEYCFSVACFFTSLIPQIIAEKEDGEELFFDYALASGWPIINCGMGGLLSAVQVVLEAGLLPNEDELDDYGKILEAAEIYFTNDVRGFLAGGENTLNSESYLRLCENVKDRIDEICGQIHSRTEEYLNALKDGTPYDSNMMLWRGQDKSPSYLPKDIYRDRRDGQVYRFVKIGDQVWMSENLRYKTDGARAYDDEDRYVKERGLLYTWDAANKVAPPGWRLPNSEDFQKLYDYVKSKTQNAVGKALKSKNLWSSGAGTDELGFHAVPAGAGEMQFPYYAAYYGMENGEKIDVNRLYLFKLLDECVQFWTSEREEKGGIYWVLDHFHDDFKKLYRVTSSMFSVRLIKE